MCLFKLIFTIPTFTRLKFLTLRSNSSVPPHPQHTWPDL